MKKLILVLSALATAVSAFALTPETEFKSAATLLACRTDSGQQLIFQEGDYSDKAPQLFFYLDADPPVRFNAKAHDAVSFPHTPIDGLSYATVIVRDEARQTFFSLFSAKNSTGETVKAGVIIENHTGRQEILCQTDSLGSVTADHMHHLTNTRMERIPNLPVPGLPHKQSDANPAELFR